MTSIKNNVEFRNFYFNKKIKSQNGQDAFVLDYFNFKKDGVFVDIGAHDGFSFSNTYVLEKNYNWKGICIEPIYLTFQKLEKNRNCIKLNIGISDVDGLEKFSYIEKSSRTLSGMVKEYHLKHLERINELSKKLDSKLIEIDVPCKTINDVLIEHNTYKVDYLNIDTEGNEFKILRSLNFEKFSIECMTVENNYNNKEQRQYILSKGYKLMGRLGGDEVFVK